MLPVRDFMAKVIGAWEGLYSSDANDPGNWTGGQVGAGRMIGSMRGVTPAVLARHRLVNVDSLTQADMKGVTLDEAADIGESLFYRAPCFNLLTWAPATASLVDFGWGAGPGQAVKSMQRLVGANADGALGPMTAAAYNAWLAARSNTETAEAIHGMRIDFYHLICDRNPSLSIYLNGWLNRAAWALKEAS